MGAADEQPRFGSILHHLDPYDPAQWGLDPTTPLDDNGHIIRTTPEESQ